MFATFLFLSLAIVAYLVGSICSAVIVCRLFDLPDPRTAGSRNPGATNVLRLAGKQYAIMVLLGDMLKGLLPVLLGKMLGAGPVMLGFVCLAAVLGHIYPIFFGFKGGKGVATAIGALLGLHFILGVVVIATWLLVANFSRYSSLASIISIILAPFYSLFAVRGLDPFLPIFFITLVILYQHRENITRLMDGTEGKINFQPKTQNATVVQKTKTSKKATTVTLPKKATAKKTTLKKTAPKKTTQKVAVEKKPARAKKTTSKK